MANHLKISNFLFNATNGESIDISGFSASELYPSNSNIVKLKIHITDTDSAVTTDADTVKIGIKNTDLSASSKPVLWRFISLIVSIINNNVNLGFSAVQLDNELFITRKEYQQWNTSNHIYENGSNGWRLDISSVHNVSFLLLSVTAEILKSIIVNLLESEQIFASVKQGLKRIEEIADVRLITTHESTDDFEIPDKAKYFKEAKDDRLQNLLIRKPTQETQGNKYKFIIIDYSPIAPIKIYWQYDLLHDDITEEDVKENAINLVTYCRLHYLRTNTEAEETARDTLGKQPPTRSSLEIDNEIKEEEIKLKNTQANLVPIVV